MILVKRHCKQINGHSPHVPVDCICLKFLFCHVTVVFSKKQKAKTKPKSGSAVKETQNGLPSRVTSNGLIDDAVSGATDVTGSVTGRRKSKSSRRGKTYKSRSTVESPCSVEMASDKQVNISEFNQQYSQLN